MFDFKNGDHFYLVVTYSPLSSNFKMTYNGEDLSSYSVPSQEIAFDTAIAEGDVSVSYYGFPMDGVNPAQPVGTLIRYRCPPFHKFSHDWYAPTVVNIECKVTGQFTKPQNWGVCVIRKHAIFLLNLRSLNSHI